MSNDLQALIASNMNRIALEGKMAHKTAGRPPHLTIQRFHSLGNASRVDEASSDEPLHFHSLLEKYHWLVRRAGPGFVGARSQVPLLPETEPLEIAEKLRLPPPRLSKRWPCMTTDLVEFYTEEGTLRVRAFNVKYARDRVGRNLELFEVEKEFWRRRDVTLEWRTEEDLDQCHLWNLRLTRKFRDPESVLPGEGERRWQLTSLLRSSAERQAPVTLLDVCRDFDVEYRLERTTAMSLFWWASEHRKWLDLVRPIRPMMFCAYLPWLS
jgi:hypothetical protein